MKKQSLIPLLAMVLVLAAGATYAQLPSPGGLKANIPFSFIVGKTTFPAGEYTVKNSLIDGVLQISAEDSSRRALISTLGVEANKGSNQTKLIFHRYGDQYFLSQIWVENEASGRELPRTRTEKELRAKAASDSVTILAAK
jgi:hypothetical protein